MIFRAIEFAARAHSGCYRKVTHIPYLNHPLSVARILIEFGFDEEPLAVAAVLHDTVENSMVSVAQLRNEFGDEVAFLVDSVSDPDKSGSWQQRKTRLMRYLETARFEVLVLSCADKLDNLRSIRCDLQRLGDTVWQLLNGDKKDQCWYYTSLSLLFGRQLATTEAQALATEFQREVYRVFDREEGYEQGEP